METPSTESSRETQDQSATNTSAGEQSASRTGVLVRRAREARDQIRQRAERLPNIWAVLKKRPVLGIGVAVGGGLGLAAAVGAAETAVALSAGILAYQTLTRSSGSHDGSGRASA
jgi:hypothetical protein